MLFVVCSCVFGAVFFLLAFIVIEGERRCPEFLRGLPRNRILGEVVGVIALGWAAYHVCGMLEGGIARYRIVIRALVPVIALLAYGHLDYLFARAFGGIVLLAVNLLLHEGFSVNVPFRPAFSAVCYFVGFIGLILIAAPWQMRDFLERCRNRRQVCHTSAGIMGFIGGFLIVFGILAL